MNLIALGCLGGRVQFVLSVVHFQYRLQYRLATIERLAVFVIEMVPLALAHTRLLLCNTIATFIHTYSLTAFLPGWLPACTLLMHRLLIKDWP